MGSPGGGAKIGAPGGATCLILFVTSSSTSWTARLAGTGFKALEAEDTEVDIDTV